MTAPEGDLAVLQNVLLHNRSIVFEKYTSICIGTYTRNSN
jgi:hypothetical protein